MEDLKWSFGKANLEKACHQDNLLVAIQNSKHAYYYPIQPSVLFIEKENSLESPPRTFA